MTERRPPRSRLAALFPFLELLGLSGVAVASPVLQVFADGAEVFVAYRASRSEIVLFALVVVLVVPAVLFGLELLAGLLGPTWRRLAHTGAVVLLLGILVLQVVKSETDLRRPAAIALASALALLGAAAVWRWQLPRLFLRFLSVAPPGLDLTYLEQPRRRKWWTMVPPSLLRDAATASSCCAWASRRSGGACSTRSACGRRTRRRPPSAPDRPRGRAPGRRPSDRSGGGR